MSHSEQNGWVVLSPVFPEHSVAPHAFRAYAKIMSKMVRRGESAAFDSALADALNEVSGEPHTTALRAALCLLTDIARQRWAIRVSRSGRVEVKRPPDDRRDPMGEKARIRAQELIKRDEQLREPSTRKFIQGMEKQANYRGKFVSIFTLFRDGRELAQALRKVRDLAKEERLQALRAVIDPYIQFVDKSERCEYTGLNFQDIWRYFRHTWTNQYTSTPGRTMSFLIRDRAQPFHPVIGIGSLGSPIVQIRERDVWIGWHQEAFLESIAESPTIESGLWLQKVVDTALDELYVDDFIEEQLINSNDLREPTAKVVAALLEFGKTQRELHHRLARSRDLKESIEDSESQCAITGWQKRARSHLYRSKRALSLADMLQSRMVLRRFLSPVPTLDQIRDLIASPAGCRTVKRVLRKARADRVGIAMADITVCGAVAPYGPLLGGKLVSMLASSPEVVMAYRDKYLDQQSEIASSMAGRPIVRPSQLVFLGTTSLYGVGSSQYNRLSMPAGRIGGREGERLEYLEIGKSEAFGTSHFTSDTVDALVALVQQSGNGVRVNSIFGEGVSPKLRKIRDGLDKLRLPADALLQHGRQRIIYGIPLVRNLRRFLLGMDSKPDYIFDISSYDNVSAEIASWWLERWLLRRIESEDVLAQVEKHTLVRPIRHGARVVLPPIADSQVFLFDDLD